MFVFKAVQQRFIRNPILPAKLKVCPCLTHNVLLISDWAKEGENEGGGNKDRGDSTDLRGFTEMEKALRLV